MRLLPPREALDIRPITLSLLCCPTVFAVTFSPELSAPQLILHLWCFRKLFARNYTLHRRDRSASDCNSAPIGSESVLGILILFDRKTISLRFLLLSMQASLRTSCSLIATSVYFAALTSIHERRYICDFSGCNGHCAAVHYHLHSDGDASGNSTLNSVSSPFSIFSLFR